MRNDLAVRAKAARKGLSKVNYNRYGYFFVLPFVVVFIIFQLYPILFTFRTSFSDAIGWEKINASALIGTGNYKLFFDPGSVLFKEFWTTFQNTLLIWIVNFVPQIVMALLLANWFTDSRMRLRFQGGFKVIIFMPNIITAATIAILFFSLFGYPVAPVNTLMQQIGVFSKPFEFFRNVEASRGIISFIQWWMWYGNTMIILTAGILGIDPTLFEAGLVDGCRSRDIFWKITMPLIKPILLYTLVTSMIGGLQMFDIPHLLTQGNPNGTTNTVARFIYNQAFTGSRNFNYASAASVILFGMIVVASTIMFLMMNDRDHTKLARRDAK
ncbi:MAG: sugar ABC transporter permease [Candidatus Limiplasma sp.]|nr:sugar ABC transporter permease [Candidatus Limiplasma sp.]